MKSYSDKTPPDSMKAMKPDTTAPEDDGDLDNDDMSDGEGGTSGFIDKGLGLVSENDDHFNADACLTKRAKNNNRERERKEKIKNDMMELKTLLPSEMQSDKKQTHHDLLQLAISYMRSLLYQSNSLKLNQITSNQNSQSSDSQTQKDLEDLRSELAKYKLFFNNAGLPQGIDLSQILINWRFKTPEELLCNPGVGLDVNLPVFQQQQQQQFFTQQQQQPQQQFNQFQSQGIFQNLSGNQQTLAQFTAMTNQGHQLQPASQQMQQQVAFNHNLQQISFAQQSFSLTQHTELQQQQHQQQQHQQHQFQQQLGYVQQNVQTTFETDAKDGLAPASDPATPRVARAGSMSNQNALQDFMGSQETQEFATSTALEVTQNDPIPMNPTNNIPNHNGSSVPGGSQSIDDGDTSNVKENTTSTNEMLGMGSSNCIGNNDNVSTSFVGKQTGTSGNSLTDLLSSDEMCADEMVSAASSSSAFMPFETSTTDSNFQQLQQQQQQQQQQQHGVTSFEDNQLKSSSSLDMGHVGGICMSDCNRMESFASAPNITQFQQTQQNIIGHQQFHFSSNGELMADGCGSSVSLPSGNHDDPNSQQQQQQHQTMQSSLILQNGQLILVNNNNNCNAINNSANVNQQQLQQNFFMQPQQQNVLTQQNGFIGQAGNMTIQTDHNQLLAQQQGSTQFIGPTGSINFLTGHGLPTNIAAGGSVFQNHVGIINPMNVLGGTVPQNYNQTLTMNTPQGQMMMPAKANDQPQALILPDGQIIPVVTQPNLLFPSQQCIPVTGSLLVPSVGASQGRACPLQNILSTKPQPTASLGSSRSKKRQQTASSMAPPSNLQNVTLPPSMTAVLTPEGNVILSFPTSSASQTQVENKPNAGNAGMKSSQRPLMPKPAGVIQHHQNLFETKMFAQPQTPFFQNILNLQPGTNQQPLSVMPLVQHQNSQFIQPVPGLSMSNEMHDLSSRGIECISPAIPQSGDAFLQTPNAILSAGNQLGCNPPLFHQVASFNQNCYSASNANEVTTSTGNVEPTAASEVKKKPKKKKKKKPLTVSDSQISANDPIQEAFKDAGNGILVKTGTDFNQEKEVDITDFSDLIRMEPMTPRPPDTSGRLTPPSQHFRTPVMNTPIVTGTKQVQSTDNLDNILGLDNSKPTSQHLLIKSESLNIPRANEVASCTPGDFSSCGFNDSLLMMTPLKGLLPGVALTTTTHTFSTLSLSPSLTSIPSSTSPTISTDAALPTNLPVEISSRLDPSLGNCSLPRSSSDEGATLTISSVGALSKSGGRKKQRKQAKKSLNYSDSLQSQNPSSDPVYTLAASAAQLLSHDSGNANPESHASLAITSSCVQSVSAPISAVLPLVKESTKTSKGTKRSRSKVARLSPLHFDARATKMDDCKTIAEHSKSTSLTSFGTEGTEKNQSSSRRTRSQSKSQELRDHQTIVEATGVEITGEVVSGKTSANASHDDSIYSPPSKKRPNKADPPVTSALKVPLKVPSPMLAASSRQLVISVEKLSDSLIGESASHLAGGSSSLGTDDGSCSKNAASAGEDDVLPAAGSETSATATTEEGTQTLRSELKSMKQERRARKLQEKKKKLQSKDLDVEKPSNGPNSDMLSPPAGTLVDDSVQLDLELFNLVDQVERNMAASTQTESKSKRAQKSKMALEIEDHGDSKRSKVEDTGQTSRGKDNSLTMKLKRVDNQSNFIVESPVDLNLGSPAPSLSKSNSPARSFPKSTSQHCGSSASRSSDSNSQVAAGDNSFYGSRYLPLVNTSSDYGPCVPDESCYASSKNDGMTQNSISSKPYYVLKQPTLVRSEQSACDSSAKNDAGTNKDDDLEETTDCSSDDKLAKGGHAIFQSLAKNLSAPTKQVSSKMSSQMARMKQDQSRSSEGTTEPEERRNEKRMAKKPKNEATGKAASREKNMDEGVRPAGVANNNLQELNQCTNTHNNPSPNCYDLSLNNSKLTSKQDDTSPDKRRSGDPEANSTKPLNQCMNQEGSTARPCSQDQLSSCALTSKISAHENQRKSLPSCRQDKDKKQKDQDLCLNSREQTDCSYQSSQSKPVGSLAHQGDYQSGQVAKQQDGSSCQSSRRRSRNEEEDKRSNSVGYHQTGGNYASNSAGQSGHPYYKTEQAFAGAHPSYYMNPYFDVLHPSTRFNPGLTGLPFEASTSLNFLRDCASVFPAFQSPSASFGSNFSCQRGMNSLSKEAMEADNRRSVESNQSNRNSLESNGRGSHQQQQNQTPSLPSCKSAGSSSSYLDGQPQHQTHSTDKTSMAKQTSNAKKLSKTPVLNYETPTMFEHMSPMSPFFSFGGLSPNKSHHPAHLSSSYFASPTFFPEAARNINKGSATNSRTLHHRGVDEGFNKNSPSASSGLDFSSQDFSSARNSMAHQQGRTNAFIGNSMPAHHHSFGFGGFFPDAHQMASPLGHRGAQASASNYYSSYNQQQAMGSNSLSRNSSISRGPSLHSEMALNNFWGNQQAAFDPRAIGHPFSTHTFPM